MISSWPLMASTTLVVERERRMFSGELRKAKTMWMRWKQRRLPLDGCAAEKKPSYQAAWIPPLAAQKPDAAERLRRRQQARARYNEACQRVPERPVWQAARS
jgi:hypothetical protein